MASATMKVTPSASWSSARLRRHLGMIPSERIMLIPYPGSATVEDVLTLDDHDHVICELVEGVLVRKPIGAEESMLAMLIGHFLLISVRKHDLGVVLGEAGFIELAPKQVRAPDVSFVSWDRLPGRRLPKKRIPRLIPDLAVEVLSESNTAKEMLRKRRAFFEGGTRLVWQVNPAAKTVEVFTSPEESTVLGVRQTLDGGEVLPRFKLKINKLFPSTRKRE